MSKWIAAGTIACFLIFGGMLWAALVHIGFIALSVVGLVLGAFVACNWPEENNA